jgi:uncharacterized membrane protein
VSGSATKTRLDDTVIAAPDLRLHRIACVCLVLLIILCVAWELWLAPVRPGGSWLVLKVLPLLLPLRGVLKRDNYTMQWSILMIWLYFIEGAVRAASDHGLSQALAGAEVALVVVYFGSVAMYLRPLKQQARKLKQETKNEPDRS